MAIDNKKKALGRGLDALLPSSRPATTPAAAVGAAAMASGEGAREIPVNMIERNPYQTRTSFNEDALKELTASVRASGVVQPILVRPLPMQAGGSVAGAGPQRYQLITGERRWQASQRAGKQTIPAVVRKVSDEQALEITIVENLQREDLQPLEQARAFERLGREFLMTQEQIASRTGKDRTTIANYLRLLKLPPMTQLHLTTGAISFGHARALLPLENPETIAAAAEKVVRDGYSVRKTEELVAHMMQPPAPAGTKPVRPVDPNVRDAERRLKESLGVNVEIFDRSGKGKIILRYKDLEDFDRILEMLTD